MHNGATARCASDDWERATGFVRVTFGVGLKVAQRQRGLAPTIDTQQDTLPLSGCFQQALIEGHVLYPITGCVN
jgi:hypothetical protein